MGSVGGQRNYPSTRGGATDTNPLVLHRCSHLCAVGFPSRHAMALVLRTLHRRNQNKLKRSSLQEIHNVFATFTAQTSTAQWSSSLPLWLK